MKVSWIVLTYNRGVKVAKAMAHNIANAGEPHDELVWVDNGSTDGVRAVMRDFAPNISVLHDRNQGVARGYNRGMALATGDYLVITGCDMLMPDGWLKTFKDYVRQIPDTGIACMYHRPLESVPERRRKTAGGDAWCRQVISGLEVVHAMPIERRFFSRSLLGKIGFLREDFGLYGWEDVEWAHRAERVCNALGLLTYVIPGMQPVHLGTEGVSQHVAGGDDPSYHAFKQKEANDPNKIEVLNRCQRSNWPYYNPYALPWSEMDSPRSREYSIKKFVI